MKQLLPHHLPLVSPLLLALQLDNQRLMRQTQTTNQCLNGVEQAEKVDTSREAKIAELSILEQQKKKKDLMLGRWF